MIAATSLVVRDIEIVKQQGGEKSSQFSFCRLEVWYGNKHIDDDDRRKLVRVEKIQQNAPDFLDLSLTTTNDRGCLQFRVFKSVKS